MRKKRMDAICDKPPKFKLSKSRVTALETLKKIYGSQEKIGKAVGVQQQAVSRWFKGLAEMEYWRAAYFEKETKGLVKATHLSRFAKNLG